MKKHLSLSIIFLVCILLLVSCTPKTEVEIAEVVTEPAASDIIENADATETEAEEEQEEAVTEEAEQPESTKMLPFEGSKTFLFSSGAGGWYTELILNDDGTFTGHFQDSEMGADGDGYKGTMYLCDFSGSFKSAEKLDIYSYKLTLNELNINTEKSEEWIEGETKYVPSKPYGMENCEMFMLYLPGTNVTQFPEDFLSWWQKYMTASDKPTNLDCYALHNTEESLVFFSE